MKSNSCESCFATNFRNTVFDESTIIQASVIILIKHLFVSVCQLQFGRIEIIFWEIYANYHAANHNNDNYNEHDGLSNHQTHVCLRNRLFRRRWNEISKHRLTCFCEGNSPVTDEFPAQRASNAEMLSFDDVIMYNLIAIKQQCVHTKLCFNCSGLHTYRPSNL